ncbi:ATP-grasp domain-containing protein [Chryseobacterium sp. SC28]|uniref:ATP-grasp domain-containing protein n=1 Tax=Chryseobacterium sp. SC28 TaxID=2268028 RepID=UPI000F649037|nr:ATP-grasp domain-containing protein [Chryseobacterium sp. SC28]RRQ45326.1 ATP-grasp domain-containing protein [Chryseobacterium sp. SC28]
MKTNIIITSAGQRVSLVKAFQKELQKKYPHSKVIALDRCPELSAACQVADGFYKICSVTDDHYVSELLQICKKENVGMIIPTIDTELRILSESKPIFQAEKIHLIISDEKFIKQCRDKRELNHFFSEYNIRFPRPVDKHQPSFPLFIKPFDGSLSKDIFIIREASELTDFHIGQPKFMFMEYIDPDHYKEYTVDCYYNRKNQLSCAVPRQRIAVRSGEIHKGVTDKNSIMDYLKTKISTIPGAIGCITFQLFYNKDNQDIIAIEINPRFGGGYPLSYEAGANYPKMLIEEYFEDKAIHYTDDWEDRLLMLRYDAEVLVRNYE